MHKGLETRLDTAIGIKNAFKDNAISKHDTTNGLMLQMHTPLAAISSN